MHEDPDSAASLVKSSQFHQAIYRFHFYDILSIFFIVLLLL